MSMALRYKGGFYSYNNVLYDIEIWQEGFTGSVSDVAFCASPLEIEWSEVDKIEPVQSSHATLQLFSDTDRQFIDMYAIKAGSIRMDVYRSGSLYWSGTLDTELYEEPFSYKNNYGVKLTFSDMALLERTKFDRTGFMTLRDFIVYTIHKCGINYTAIEEHISTRMTEYDTTTSLLDDVSVIADNFYDEDGEALTVRKALEGTLKPLALHIIQKAGKVFIYDLNSVLTAFTPSEIAWSADDATLGSDKVYNNVKVTFSPYERKTLLSGEVKLKDDPNARTITTWVNTESADAEIGFKTHLSDNGSGLEKNAAARFMSIEPVYSGSEETGIAWTVRTLKPGETSYASALNMPTKDTNAMLLKVPTLAYLANVGYSIRNNYKLKVNIQLLADVRYNPFEEAAGTNEEGDNDNMKNWCNFVYIPFILTLRDAAGTALYHWTNNTVKASNSYDRSGCAWAAGEGSWGDAWLCWYSGNRKNETGIGGWQSNKQIIGYYRGEKLPYTFDKSDAGEYVDMPSAAGWLELQIGTGILCYDYGGDSPKLREDIYPIMRWLMYKEPTIKIVSKYYKDIDTKDIELKAWLNIDAQEDLKIETIIGTLEESKPTALGQFFRSSDKSVLATFYRNGVTDRIEKLLIGTIYSNYADRHITLSGTTELLPSFGIYSDRNQAGTYMMLSETQHLQDDESEIKVAAFEADNYTAVKYAEVDE